MGLAQSPFGQLMIQPQNIYNTVSKMVELGGQKNVNDFILNPQGQPVPQSGPPPQLMLEQAKMQQQGQIKQMELQFKAQADEMQRRQQAELELIRQRAQRRPTPTGRPWKLGDAPHEAGAGGRIAGPCVRSTKTNATCAKWSSSAGRQSLMHR